MLFEAFPDFAFEIIDATTYRDRCAIRWRARGTFAGPGRFQGFEHNGARVSIEGCDVFTVADGLIAHADAYFDSGDVARQLGLLPQAGSKGEARLTTVANAGTRLRRAAGGAPAEAIAAGVWVVRGGRMRNMNVYLIADEGGDHDVRRRHLGDARRARLRLRAPGGIKRVVLGHADADHRGAAGALGAPIYCHPAERAAAQSPSSFRDYWDLHQLAAFARPIYPWLLRSWDGGAVDDRGHRAGGRRDRRLRGRRAPGPRSRSDRPVPRGGSARARLRLHLHAGPADRDQGRPQGSASGVRPGCRSGPGVDPQARRAGPERGLGRAMRSRSSGDVVDELERAASARI